MSVMQIFTNPRPREVEWECPVPGCKQRAWDDSELTIQCPDDGEVMVEVTR